MQEDDFFHESGTKFTPGTGAGSDAVFKRLTITWYEFLARGRLTSSVCASVRKKTEQQQHSSRACPRFTFLLQRLKYRCM